MNGPITSVKVFARYLCVVFLVCISLLTIGQQDVPAKLRTNIGRVFFEEKEPNTFSLRNWIHGNDSIRSENPRLVAIALDITLGVLGMHRLYLGTDLKVPIFYTLTLGGGGILWVVDLGLLIFSDDIERFKDNAKLFMWVD